MQPNESLYDQKPEAAPVQVSTSISSAPAVGTSFTSRFEYVDNTQEAHKGSGRNQVISHVNPPTSTSFFADYGMENGFQKKTSSSFKVQVSSMTFDYLVSSTKFCCKNCDNCYFCLADLIAANK